MITSAHAVFRHASIRFRAVATQPAACIMMLLCAAATLLFWPGIAGMSGNKWSAFAPGHSWGEDPVPAIVVFVMLLTLPMLPAYFAVGRATGRGRDTFILRGMPGLPIGPMGRALGELLVIGGYIFIVRAPSYFLVSPPDRAAFFMDTLIGCAVFLPAVVAWVSPSGSMELTWIKCILATCLAFAAVCVGLLAHPLALGAFSIVLSAAFLLAAGREWSLPSRPLFSSGGENLLYRPPMPPRSRFWRDIWEVPLRRTGPLAAGLAVFLAATLALDSLVVLPPWSFYFATVLALGVAASPLCLRPLGSNLIMMGLTGKQGARAGDFSRALTVLPLRRETVAAGAYAHGIMASGCLWAGALALVAARTFLRTGQWGLRAADGDDVAKFFWLTLALIPCIAGFLAAGAVGHRLFTALSGGALLGLFNVVGIVVLLASAIFPRGSKGPIWLGLALIVAFALLGGAPPLLLIRRPRRSSASEPGRMDGGA